MPNRNTQLLKRDNTGTIYADPLAPNFSVRFKTTTARKSVDGLLMNNVVTEIILNDLSVVTVGSKTVNDPLSIRIRTSGADASMTRIKQALVALCGQVPAWATENVILGFEPTTLPVNSVA